MRGTDGNALSPDRQRPLIGSTVFFMYYDVTMFSIYTSRVLVAPIDNNAASKNDNHKVIIVLTSYASRAIGEIARLKNIHMIMTF